MPFELKADDIMPWGKYIGMSVREIYKNAFAYYNRYLLSETKYKISAATREILEKDLPQTEFSKMPTKCSAGKSSTELNWDSPINWGPYKRRATKLVDVAHENPSYYRYLLQNGVYYISQRTMKNIALVNAEKPPIIPEKDKEGEKKKGEHHKKKTAKEVAKEIDSKIKEYEKDINPERDLNNYIGGLVPVKFSKQCAKAVEKAEKEDKYGLDDEIKNVLGKGAKFHEGQREAILSVLAGYNTLVVQRTGWGKSLVYFLSIKILREMGFGPAIIISPLIALMRDQVSKLPQYKLNGVEITSENQKQWKSIYKDISKGKYDVIFIAPEKLDNFQFMDELKKWITNISLFVIDEAHCISDWGHDFRPDFRRISRLVRDLTPSTRILATTATANDRVKRDIKHQLANRSLEIETGCLLRENFCIDVMDLPSDEQKINWLERNLPKLLKSGKGIIYCQKVKDTHAVAEQLCNMGFNAKPYNAQMDIDIKHQVVDEFTSGSIDIMVATIAFGMGVDIPDIAFVIHYQQVKGIIEYYQQIGRGGRNVKKVKKMYAITLRGEYDNDTNAWFITHGFPTAKDLDDTIAFIDDNPECSRQDIIDELNYSVKRADKVLKYLRVDGYIFRKNSRYSLGNREWTCDMTRSRVVSWYRWKEFREFNSFLDSKTCYMKQIRLALDEPHTKAIPNCGKCANCLGKHFFE